MNMVVVELPEETDTWAKAKAEAEGFLTVSDYVAHLVQQQKEIDALRAKLLAGMEGEGIPLEKVNERLRAILAAKTA